MDIIIVGGGIADMSAALAARRYYPACAITVLSAEDYPFYNRIGLVGLVTGSLPEAQFPLCRPDFLRHKRIAYKSGVHVTAIDSQKHLLETNHGPITYNKLILATGAAPFIPPIPGLSQYGQTLWNIEDARRLKETASVDKHTITIIGGGVLAIESALEFAALGHRVTIIEKEPRLMAAQLNQTAANLLQKHLEGQGIRVLVAADVRAVINQGHTIELADGKQIATDLILVQTGVRPNIELARKAGILCHRGIVVDETMATSTPDVFACGNCIEYNGELALLWNPAKEQGMVAGANLLEKRATYKPLPPVLHLKNSFGLFSCGNWQQAAQVREEADGDNYQATFLDKSNHLVGAILINDISSYPRLSASLGRQITDEDGHQLVFDGRSWVCQQCGYTYEGPLPPAVCPVCHVGRDQFIPA